MKTPEEMAEQYAETVWDESNLAPEDRAVERHVTIGKCCAKIGFIAGYKAAKDQLADAGKVMPQWISVKERLPEVDKYVLITHRISQDYTNLKVMEACRISDDEYEIWGDHSILADYVDYWMPMPQAPKEEG